MQALDEFQLLGSASQALPDAVHHHESKQSVCCSASAPELLQLYCAISKLRALSPLLSQLALCFSAGCLAAHQMMMVLLEHQAIITLLP